MRKVWCWRCQGFFEPWEQCRDAPNDSQNAWRNARKGAIFSRSLLVFGVVDHEWADGLFLYGRLGNVSGKHVSLPVTWILKVDGAHWYKRMKSWESAIFHTEWGAKTCNCLGGWALDSSTAEVHRCFKSCWVNKNRYNHRTFQVPKMEVLTYISCM